MILKFICPPYTHYNIDLHRQIAEKLHNKTVNNLELLFFFAEEGADCGEASSASKLTTWSNLGRQQMQLKGGACGGPPVAGDHPAGGPMKPERSRSRFKEENSLNNNGSSKSKSMPDMQSPAGARRSKSESRILAAAAAVDTPTSADPNYNNGGLVSAFIRSKEGSGSVTAATTKQQHRLSWDGGSGTATTSGQSMESPSSASEQIPMVKSKDTVNHFLKNKLTSIEETESSGSQSKLLAEAAAGAAAAAAAV